MKVFVYFNLTKKIFSVKALEGEKKGKVIFHAERIYLADAIAKVSEKTRQRVIREKKKYVHAGIVGELISAVSGFGSTAKVQFRVSEERTHEAFLDAGDMPMDYITYNPHVSGEFRSRMHGRGFKKAKLVQMHLLDKTPTVVTLGGDFEEQ